MSEDTAMRSLDIAFASPSSRIKIEFQGGDPVYHHATQGDALGIKPLSAFCARQKGIMGLLLDILENSPGDAAVLRRWAAP